MNTNLSARLDRIESRLREIEPGSNPDRIDIATGLQAAREAYARGEPLPRREIDLDDPTLTWAQRELRRGLIEARERVARMSAEYAAQRHAKSKTEPGEVAP